MASLVLRSAGRVLRRSLPQGFFRRTPAQPFMDNPRLFSSAGVNKHSCKLEKGLPQRIEDRLASMEAHVAEICRTRRATREQLELILKRKIENELANAKKWYWVSLLFLALPFVLVKHYLVESRRRNVRGS